MKALFSAVLIGALLSGGGALAQRFEMDTELRRDKDGDELRVNHAFNSFAACVFNNVEPFRDRTKSAEYRRRFKDMIELQGHIARYLAEGCKEEYQEALDDLKQGGTFSAQRRRDFETGINAFAMAVTGFVAWRLWEGGTKR
jgi:hypothetical protein